jgi:hypothetical protein
MVRDPYEHKTGVIPGPGVIQEPGVNPAGNRRETYPKNRGETLHYRGKTLRYSLGFPPVYWRDSRERPRDSHRAPESGRVPT